MTEDDLSPAGRAGFHLAQKIVYRAIDTAESPADTEAFMAHVGYIIGRENKAEREQFMIGYERGLAEALDEQRLHYAAHQAQPLPAEPYRPKPPL